MDTEKINNMIANLVSKKQQLQRQISKRREIILKEQNTIADLQEQVDDIDSNISNIRVRAEKQNNVKPMQKPNNNNPMDVEESDAAISTGAMDAASPGIGGATGGWRHYSKMGEVLKLPIPSDERKKKKKIKIEEFMNSFLESIEKDK